MAQGKSTGSNATTQLQYDGPGELAAALDDFDERIIMDPLAYSEIRTRPSLEERLESIISGAALMVYVTFINNFLRRQTNNISKFRLIHLVLAMIVESVSLLSVMPSVKRSKTC